MLGLFFYIQNVEDIYSVVVGWQVGKFKMDIYNCWVGVGVDVRQSGFYWVQVGDCFCFISDVVNGGFFVQCLYFSNGFYCFIVEEVIVDCGVGFKCFQLQ